MPRTTIITCTAHRSVNEKDVRRYLYYLALLNPDDAAHQRALAATLGRAGKLITTHWVLIEVADAMCMPKNRARFSKLFQALENDPSTTIVAPTVRLFRAGATLFADRPDKSWSLTDCISLVVMDQHNIAEALTADHHFEQAGFQPLLA